MQGERRFATILLGASIFATGFCGLVSEFLLSTVSSYILGNSIEQFSVIIALMMAMMGLAGALQKFFPERRLVEQFIAVEILLAAMANSAAVSNKGGTPLFYAAMNGHVGCVHQLLLIGSDPHVETEWGTAEQQAQLKGHTAVVELLRNPPTMEAPQMPTLLVMNEEANE